MIGRSSHFIQKDSSVLSIPTQISSPTKFVIAPQLLAKFQPRAFEKSEGFTGGGLLALFYAATNNKKQLTFES